LPKSSADRFERFYDFLGFTLEPFQKEIVGELFAGRRESLILIPRGNGKSTLLAALSLFHLLTRPDAKVAIGAASREQALTLFEMARSMAQHPQIASQVQITRRELRTKTGWVRVVSSDGPKQHGLVLTLAIVDELHAHKDDELYIAFRTGMMKVDDAQMWTISTAGIGEESALGSLRARAMKGQIERKASLLKAVSPSLGMLEWALGEKADVDDFKVVKSVNPASWMTEAKLEEQRDAVHDIAYRRYHCNQWVAAQAPWIYGDLWDACNGEPEFPGVREVLGVDASIRHDSTCVARVRRDPDGTFHASFRIWEPQRGREVELQQVEDYIRDQCKLHNVIAVVYDPQFMHHAAQRLGDEGIRMMEWKQDNARMVPATRTLHEAVVHKRLRHGGHPIARTHALNAAVQETERGVRIKKTISQGRIDCIVALAMAVEWADRQDQQPVSVYDDRPLAVV
jgi:phage terminase large subunit-like protein